MGVISFIFIGIGFFFLLLGVIISSSKKKSPLSNNLMEQQNDLLHHSSLVNHPNQQIINPATIHLHETAAVIKEQNKSLGKDIETIHRSISEIRSKNEEASVNRVDGSNTHLIQHLQNEINSLKNQISSSKEVTNLESQIKQKNDNNLQYLQEKEILSMKEQVIELKKQLQQIQIQTTYNKEESVEKEMLSMKEQVIELKQQLQQIQTDATSNQENSLKKEMLSMKEQAIELKKQLQEISTHTSSNKEEKYPTLQNNHNYLATQEECLLYLDHNKHNVYTGSNSDFSIAETSKIKRTGEGSLLYDGTTFYFEHKSENIMFHLNELKHISLYPNCIVLVHKTNKPTAIIFMKTTKALKSVLSTLS